MDDHDFRARELNQFNAHNTRIGCDDHFQSYNYLCWCALTGESLKMRIPPTLLTRFRVCTCRVNSFVPPLSVQIRNFSWGNVSTARLPTSRLQVQATNPLYIYVRVGLPPLRTVNHNVLVLSQARTLHCTSHKQARSSPADKFEKDDSIPFLQSKAHNFRVDDAYTVDTAKDRSRQKVALPLGVGIFAVIMYIGFFRDYGTKDRSVMGFLTRDIGDKLPDDVRQRIYSEVDQSKLSDQTLSGANDK